MEIRKVEQSIEKIIVGAEYLGSGASKEAYLKDEKVIKIPRGRFIIQDKNFCVKFPNHIDDVDDFLAEIATYDESLVWPLGQFAIELLTWEALLDLETKGVDISSFARITDYYFDENNIIVIEQELVDSNADIEDELSNKAKWTNFTEQIDKINIMLQENYNIILTDISSNVGIDKNGTWKLFDFGISNSTSLETYGSYSDCGGSDSCNY